MTVRTAPIFIDGNTHPAEETRQALGSLQGTATGSFAGGVGASDRAHGVVNVNDFAVVQRAAGANMSVDVGAGYAWVRGTESANQGAYHVYNDGTVNLSIAAADATNPRIDLVIIRVQDAFYSGATRTASVTVVTGTPAASPADPTLPANALVLARVRVAAAASSITTANITDVRTRAASGSESYSRTGFKNFVMNGDFRLNQRAWTTSTASGTYGFDRWAQFNSGGTVTYTPQTFTVGTQVGDYQPQNFARIVTSGQSAAGDYALLRQTIEDVRSLAGGTATISFWAKATTSAAATPAKMAVELVQTFGTGGSPSADVSTPAGQVTLTTSWARYSVTVAVPSISGKTIGTTVNTSGLQLNLWVSAGSTYNTRSGTLGIQSNTFDIWGVQVERGSFPTAFEERPLQTELALCQRYYEKSYEQATAPGTTTDVGSIAFSGTSGGDATFLMTIRYAVPKRSAITPTMYGSAGTAGNYFHQRSGASGDLAVTSFAASQSSYTFYVAAGSGWGALRAWGQFVANAEY